MRIQQVTIYTKIPTANQYLAWERSRGKTGKLKRISENSIIEWLLVDGIKPVTNYPATLLYIWFCSDKRTDKSNIRFGEKFVEDALQKAGIIRNDGWSELADPLHIFSIDKDNPRLELTITEDK
jgi:hypothetical protein